MERRTCRLQVEEEYLNAMMNSSLIGGWVSAMSVVWVVVFVAGNRIYGMKSREGRMIRMIMIPAVWLCSSRYSNVFGTTLMMERVS